jgi:hypothetical protein
MSSPEGPRKQLAALGQALGLAPRLRVLDLATCIGATCIGATCIGDGAEGTVHLLQRSLHPGGLMLIGEPYWRREPPDQNTVEASEATDKNDFLSLPELVERFVELGNDVVEWCSPIRTAGIATMRHSGSTSAAGSTGTPMTSWLPRCELSCPPPPPSAPGTNLTSSPP